MAPEDAIHNKAKECLEAFSDCIEAMTLTPWLQCQLDRFNPWATHNSILVWHLRERAELVEMILQLLALLHEYLSDPSDADGTVLAEIRADIRNARRERLQQEPDPSQNLLREYEDDGERVLENMKRLREEEELPKLELKYRRDCEVDISTPLQTESEAKEECEEKLPKLEEIWERIAPELSKFTKKYRDLVQDAQDGPRGYRPTRIAIIDTGMLDIRPDTDNMGDSATDRQQVDALCANEQHEHLSRRPMDETLWSRVKAGRSFVGDDDGSSQQFLASNAHGTQMARIIGSIDPCCDLYIARVASRRSGITYEAVDKAIRWAMSKGVDVISMSFSLRGKTNELEDACREATKRRIAMLCSAHDGGIHLTHAYPAAFFGTIPIMACDESGMVPRGNKKLGNEFAVNAPVEIVPVLNCNDNVTRSSVATAIAAGLCSLSLSWPSAGPWGRGED
ncbi:peptidase S8/S53 domain-containing protein [Trichoderma pleuroticola]